MKIPQCEIAKQQQQQQQEDGESGDKFLNLNDEEREVVKRANLKLAQKVGFFQCKLFLTSSYLVPLLFK